MNSDFEKEIENLINKYSQENGSNTPDFLLAKYLTGCLTVFNSVITAREVWYGRKDISEVLKNPITKPDKNVKVPEFDYLTEGFDPAKLPKKKKK